MITIYCLASEDTIWYVGSTKDCKERLRYHKRPNNNCSSKDIPEDVEWKFIALEEVEEDIRYDAERFYYEWLEPKLNRKVPGRTDAEKNRDFRINNPDYHTKYNIKNKDHNNEIRRINRQARGGRAGMRAEGKTYC